MRAFPDSTLHRPGNIIKSIASKSHQTFLQFGACHFAVVIFIYQTSQQITVSAGSPWAHPATHLQESTWRVCYTHVGSDDQEIVWGSHHRSLPSAVSTDQTRTVSPPQWLEEAGGPAPWRVRRPPQWPNSAGQSSTNKWKSPDRRPKIWNPSTWGHWWLANLPLRPTGYGSKNLRALNWRSSSARNWRRVFVPRPLSRSEHLAKAQTSQTSQNSFSWTWDHGKSPTDPNSISEMNLDKLTQRQEK